MNKPIFLLAAFFHIVAFAYSQSISNSYINPGYGQLENNHQLTYSTGDVFYGEISNADLRLSGMLYTSFTDMPTAVQDHVEQDLSFYPNPCRSVLHIRTDISDLLVFRLINLNGVLLMEKLLNKNHTVDLSDLAGGAYILQVSDTDLNLYFTDKLIKTD